MAVSSMNWLASCCTPSACQSHKGNHANNGCTYNHSYHTNVEFCCFEHSRGTNLELLLLYSIIIRINQELTEQIRNKYEQYLKEKRRKIDTYIVLKTGTTLS